MAYRVPVPSPASSVLRHLVPHSALPAMTAGLGLALGLGFTIPSARGDAKPATIGVAEIKEGMKGYGLTVFHGTEPEKFDVEVIGVLHNFRPAQDLILIKTPHPRLDITKTVAGMSGSPIYLDGGRLAGAYAYSPALFPLEAVAGVTPIAPMLIELRRAIPPGFWPLEGAAPLPRLSTDEASAKAPERRTRYEGPPGAYDLDEHAHRLAERFGGHEGARGDRVAMVPSATPLLLGGVGSRAAESLRDAFAPLGFEPMQAGGGGRDVAPGTPLHFVDGGAIGVELVTGDVSMMAMGTVTHVEGAKLCAFGHPMLESGNAALPTSIGRILWIYATENRSMKIGETARPLGTLVNDRQSAIVVDERVRAPMFPVHVEVTEVPGGAGQVPLGAPKLSWSSQVAEEPFMSPALAATVLGSVVEATLNEKRDVTWTLQSKLTVKGLGTIELEDFGVADGGMPDSSDFAHTRVIRALGDVMNNPWQVARVEQITSVLSVKFARDVLRLRGVEVTTDTVDAGENVHLVLHLSPFAGPEVRRTVDVRMPSELAGKEVELEVMPGYDASPDVAAPDTLAELFANETRQSAPPRSVVVQYRVPGQGVSFRGHVAPDLPPFALDTLRPQHADTGPEPYPTYARVVVPLEQYIEGHDKTKVKVRARLR